VSAALVCALPASLRKLDAFEGFARVAGRRDYRVLVVEDSSDCVALVSLSDSADPHFQIDRVVHLDEAMSRLETSFYDAVLLDVALSDAEAPGAEPGTRVAPLVDRLLIVVLTGTNAPELVMTAGRLGVQEYCVKGEFEPRELPALVARAIALHRRAGPVDLSDAVDEGRAQAAPSPGVGQAVFCDRLRQALARRRRRDDRFAVVRLEVDHLGMLRDLGGADLHEEVLESAAMRLAARLREGDTLAHIDGSGFAAILEDLTSPIQARGRARQLAESLLGVHMQKECNVELTGLTASIGIACFPDDGDDVAILVEKAEEAMAWSAARGGHRIRLFSDNAA